MPRARHHAAHRAAAEAAQGAALAALDQDHADHGGGDQEMDDENDGDHDLSENSATRQCELAIPASSRRQAPPPALIDGPEAGRHPRMAPPTSTPATPGDSHDLARIVGLDRAAVEDGDRTRSRRQRGQASADRRRGCRRCRPSVAVRRCRSPIPARRPRPDLSAVASLGQAAGQLAVEHGDRLAGRTLAPRSRRCTAPRAGPPPSRRLALALTRASVSPRPCRRSEWPTMHRRGPAVLEHRRARSSR